ncbi:sigma-70 family RNA polymerase sigma factor [Candidatus Parcubacteria bacterium]|jgi:RNA polymerase sigma-70 factor (ECF subfamily)|nr:MAG: sigma-70 family RNA polymerase sigma factor [Candidatus Parcubacteria bacterium]
MMTLEDEEKIRTIFTSGHQNFNRGLNLYARSKIQDQATSEDLVEDTFMKTWVYLVKGGKIDMMKSFLYHILNNLIVDEYRRHKTLSLDSALIKIGIEPTARDPNLSEKLDGKVVILLARDLPEPYRNIINMRYIRDLSLTEMSLITGQTKNTIAVQIHRGLTKLKTLYKDKSHTKFN